MFSRLLLFVAIGSLTSCASAPALKSARVMSEGSKETYVGLATSGAHIPEIQAGIRGGVAKDIDVDIRLALFGMSGVEGRYQFMDRDRFAASVGLLLMAGGVSFDSTQTDPRTGEKQEVKSRASDFVGDLGLPLYFSYDVSREFAIYFSPRLIARQIRDGLDERRDTRVQLLTGARIGDGSGVYVEAGAEHSALENSWIGRFAIAVFWD